MTSHNMPLIMESLFTGYPIVLVLMHLNSCLSLNQQMCTVFVTDFMSVQYKGVFYNQEL